MNLKEQLEILINEAPQYGVSSQIMKQAVIPVLKSFAQQLRYEQYYLIHNAQGDWLLTTLSHRKNPELEKTVLYAFVTPEEALQFPEKSDLAFSATAIPVTHLLFQLFALGQVDSLIFREIPGNTEENKEILRTDLQASIQKQLQQFKTTPPNIA